MAVQGRFPPDWIPLRVDLVLEPTNRWLFRCVASLNALIWPRPYSRCRLWRSRSAQQWFVLTHVVVERVDVFPPPSPPPPSLSLQGAHGCSDVTASISRGDHAVVECINVCPPLLQQSHVPQSSSFSLQLVLWRWLDFPASLWTPVGAPSISDDIYNNILRPSVQDALVGTTTPTTTVAF